MLIYHRTSLLESTAQTVVNTVNCVGVMGKGLAHAFKEREPAMFSAYKRICERGALEPGKLWLWRGLTNWVLNFPTKIHWRNPSKIEWIEAGLAKFAHAYEEQGIREVSFPRLGCGNGGLDWEDVRPIMERYLSDLPIRVFIHDFAVDVGLPEHMEIIAGRLKDQDDAVASYDGFVGSLKLAIDLTGENLLNLRTASPFRASLSVDNDLVIRGDEGEWMYDAEDVRSMWVKLASGMITKDGISRVAGGGGESVVSLLSLLPQVRPVQIERFHGSGPEIAVELTPASQRVISAPASTSGQRELAWH